MSARMYAARKSFGAHADELLRLIEQRPDAAVVRRFLSGARLDSGLEGMFWLLALAEEGKPCWYAPLRAGYRDHRGIKSRTDRINICDVRLPCLHLPGRELSLLLFPQVWIETRRAIYRLDVLVCVLRGRERFWLNLEIDGGGHDGEFDAQRQKDLGLPTVRLVKKDLADGDFLSTLEDRICGALKLKA